MVDGSIKSSVYSFDFSSECLKNCFFWKGRLFKDRSFGVVEDIFAIKTHFEKDYVENYEEIFKKEGKSKENFLRKINEILKRSDFHTFLICEEILNLSWILVLYGDKELLKRYLHNFYEFFRERNSIKKINFIEKMMKKNLPLKNQKISFMSVIEEFKSERYQDHSECDLKETDFRIKKEDDILVEKFKFWDVEDFKNFNKKIKNLKKIVNKQSKNN